MREKSVSLYLLLIFTTISMMFCPAFNQVKLFLFNARHLSVKVTLQLPVVPDHPPIADLASAIEWTQGLRSLALATAQACTQQSACALASTRGECEFHSTASLLVLSIDELAPDSTCTGDEARAYNLLVSSMRSHFSRHSTILEPLRVSLKRLNALSSPAPLHLLHSVTRAAQAFSNSIAFYHSLLIALAARSGPVSSLSKSPASDPVLQALGGQGALTELFAAQKVASDVDAAADEL
jgi:hypothetical protein